MQTDSLTTGIEEKLSRVGARDRVLLLSHCMRPSQTCRGKFDKKGLNCPADCADSCVIRRCREHALKLGYRGVCIAAGGAMALRFIKEHNPKGIVAVACSRELEEGIQGVKSLAQDLQELPAIVVIPLLSDGCVDTEVDEKQVLEAIAFGCAGGGSGGKEAA